MAETTNGSQLFLVERDWSHGDVIYSIRLQSSTSVAPSVHPVARWSWEHKFSAFAVCGSSIIGIIDGQDTIIHDTVTHASTPGPRLRGFKREPAMLPVGDDMVIVMDTILRSASSAAFCVEALRRVPGGGGWRTDDSIPEAPFFTEDDLLDEEEEEEDDLDEDDACRYCISAYFTMGTRAWISVSDRGTFSLDTERGAWRMEGSWELPLQGRAFFVQELGSSVVIGLGVAGDGINHQHVCALDVVEAQPPVVRHVCQFPTAGRSGHDDVVPPPPGAVLSLAYLSDARFCVSWPIFVELSKVRGTSFKGKATSFTLLEFKCLPRDKLQVVDRGKPQVHVWPLGHCGNAYFLQPAV
ncbi:hypothetical protein BS78_02G369500 [Paspalum vaginatum]|nr:hypothetical protein BS78_02G369500 [Paspalum vaginatum]